MTKLTDEFGGLEFDGIELAQGFEIRHPIGFDPADGIVRRHQVQKMNRAFQIQILKWQTQSKRRSNEDTI